MKKALILFLTAVLMLSSLTACDIFESKNGYDPSLKCERYENCAVFTFDDFPIGETATFELARTGLGEGEIYYQVNLEAGALGISYKDNVIRVAQNLGQFTADDEMPINGSGGYVEGDKIEISFGTLSPVKGEIIIAFTEDALKAIHKDKELHEHTIIYVPTSTGHFANYTCGCPHDHGAEPHYDGDTDYICDYCKCDMTEFADEWLYDETHHWYASDDGAVYCYGEHQNFDADLNCDICGYQMSE